MGISHKRLCNSIFQVHASISAWIVAGGNKKGQSQMAVAHKETLQKL